MSIASGTGSRPNGTPKLGAKRDFGNINMARRWEVISCGLDSPAVHNGKHNFCMCASTSQRDSSLV